VPGITFLSRLTVAGNTRSLPKKEASERRFNWVGSCLALKFLDLTGKGFQGRIVSDEGKQFYNIDARSSRQKNRVPGSYGGSPSPHHADPR